MNDIRYAIRTLIKHRGFAVVAILTLALGVGANTAIFSVVNGVLLRPLPYPHAETIVEVWSTGSESAKGNHAAGDFMDVARGQRSLAALAGYREDAVTVATPGNDPVRITGAIVTAGYFDVFGMPALHGRSFSASADAATNEPMVVLSEELWRQHFSASPQTVGQRARLNGVPHTVVGIMPDSFKYPAEAKVWVLSPWPVPLPPLDVKGDLLEARDVRYFNAVARLEPGVTLAQASADLGTIVGDIARRFPETSGSRGIFLEPLRERIVGDVRGALFVLLGAVGLVLLIACANVSSLLLARASGRQRELAIRAALGAGRGRLVRQLITESLILGLAGGIAGLLAGGWAVAGLVSMLPDGMPRTEQIGLDLTVAAIAIAIAFASAFVFGLIPALQASRMHASTVLRSGDRGSAGDRRRTRTRAVLVVAEVALTLVLLVSAGLLANSFLRLQRVDPGFKSDGVTLVALPLPQSKYKDGALQAAFYERLVEGVRQRPEIASAAILFPGPLGGHSASGGYSVEGEPVPGARADRPRASIGSVSPDYFRTMGIQIVRGRDFTERDRRPAPAAVIVNTTLARRHWPGGDPIGKRLRFGEDGDSWMEIVGVVGDSRNVGLDAAPTPLVYIPYHNFPLPFMSIVARSSAGPGVVASIIRERVKQLDPDLPVDRAIPMRDIVSDSVAEPRFRTMLLGAFALMATLLAAVGVYGLISYAVTERTREIGIRVALGAKPAQVMRPVVREGLTLGLAGVIIGLAGAFAATRVLSTFLFDVEATDPVTFAGVAMLLLLVAFIASYIPSRRALRIDPITALRAEEAAMFNDLRHAVRAFVRAPAFTAIAVLTLALGIGATTAMYSVVQAALIRPVPYAEPDRLALIKERLDEGQPARLTALDFVDLQTQARSFESIAAHTGTGYTFTGDGDAEMVLGQLTSAGMFDVLKTRPVIGRSYTADENRAGRDAVAVLSHGLWQRRFGGDPRVLNREVSINGRRFLVVGVMPKEFDYPNARYALWTPLPMTGTSADGPPINRAAHYIQAIARLKPGVSMAQAQQELDALSVRFAAAHPHGNFSLRLEPLTEAVSAAARPALVLLLAGVVCLLLIACANVTGLLLARAAARAGELAVRAALGASRWRLTRLLLAETFVLYAIGGTAGVLLASWALDVVRRFGPEDVPRLSSAALDGQVLLVAAGVTLIPAMLFSAIPSLRLAARSIRHAAATRTTTASAATNRARSGLVVAQLALSLVLLVTAGLVARSFMHLQAIDTGFDAEGVVTFSVVIPNSRYPSATHMMGVANRIVDAFAARPGVSAVGTTTALPLSGQNVENGFTVDGHEPPPGMGVLGGLRAINIDYFRAIGSPMRAGRGFEAADTMRSEPVVIVNERFARQYLSHREPVGSRVKMGSAGSADPWRRVVGVVADVHHSGPTEDVRPEVFFPYEQMDPDFLTTWGRGLYVALRTTGEPAAVLGSVRAGMRSVAAEMPVNDLQPLHALMSDSVSQPRFRLFLFGAFAAVAATLAAVGLFGLMAFFVAQRTREIGIRVALGAGAREVTALVGWRAARMAAFGVALGLLGAAAAGRALQTILFGVSPLNPLTFAVAATVLLAAGAAAAYIPARRAVKLDPIAALRAE